MLDENACQVWIVHCFYIFMSIFMRNVKILFQQQNSRNHTISLKSRSLISQLI